jgi:hypothetical protein
MTVPIGHSLIVQLDSRKQMIAKRKYLREKVLIRHSVNRSSDLIPHFSGTETGESAM